MGIKELIADVTATATDIGACAITTDKMALSVGRWSKTTIPTVAVTAGVSVLLTWTGTAAVTILDVIMQLTAANTVDQTVTVQDTASSVLIQAKSSTAAGSYTNVEVSALSTEKKKVLDLGAGKSIELTLTAAFTVSTTAGKLFVHFIE